MRGDEWYKFNDGGLITEIRAYYACPSLEGVAKHEIGDYPYQQNGYPTALPKDALKARRA